MSTTFSRRLMLGGLLSIGGVRTLPAIGGVLPILWADGLHNDTVALNAWLRGEPVKLGRFGRFSYVGDTYNIRGACLCLERGITAPSSGITLNIDWCHVHCGWTPKWMADRIAEGWTPKTIPAHNQQRLIDIYGEPPVRERGT